MTATRCGQCFFTPPINYALLPTGRVNGANKEPTCSSTVEAYARFSPANSKWTKHTVAEHVSIGGNGPVLVGTPAQVADGLETWVREADVDGFNFVGPPRLLAFLVCPRNEKRRANVPVGLRPLPAVV